MHPLLGRAFPATLLALAPVAVAQTPFLLVGTGDELEGIGVVTHIEAVHVNVLGHWLVQVGTDNPAIPSVALIEGHVFRKVGDPVPTIPGAKVAGFGDWTEDLF